MSTPPSSTAKQPNTTTTVAAVGLMLFSMFFGAGNLIFPPMLGVESGENFTPAMIGFLLTGVLMPVLTVIAIAISGNGVRDLASRAGALFGLIFAIVAYLSIGALYAVPRAAAIGYELGIESTFDLSGGWWRLAGTFAFFLICFLLTLWPGKVVDTLGKALTPVLLILLAVLAIVGLQKLNSPSIPATEEYTSNPLVSGISQGYFTMDSIGALAFALIVVSAFSQKGETDHKRIVKLSGIAAFTAGFFLMLVYLGLGLVGARMPEKESYSDGAAILSSAAHLTMGNTGEIVFSLIVLLACITTVVGLTAASSTFFHELVPAISYRWWATILTLIGLAIANLGLEKILNVSGPVIGLIYPPAIVLIALSYVHLLCRQHKLVFSYRIGVAVAFLFSFIDFLAALNVPVDDLQSALSWIPLMDAGMGWLLPTIFLTAIGLVIDLTRKVPNDEDKDVDLEALDPFTANVDTEGTEDSAEVAADSATDTPTSRG